MFENRQGRETNVQQLNVKVDIRTHVKCPVLPIYKSFLVMSGLNMSRVKILVMWAEGCWDWNWQAGSLEEEQR